MLSQGQKNLQEIAPVPPPKRILRWTGLAALLAVGIGVASGILARQHQEAEVKKWTAAEAVPVVSVITPQGAAADPVVILPGDIQAWYDAPIYARVNGYLKAWYFDYGAPVKAGQLLAELDAPDLDAQLAAAEARLNATNAEVKARQAELDFAKSTYERWKSSPKGVVSVQETLSKKGDFDSATARFDASVADVNAAKGEVDRLQALESFKQITVPFNGVVTERNTDIGALINAGSGVGGGSGPVLFRIADVSRMRIFVQVPQRISADIHEGLTADLYLPQYPGRAFKATVATTSRAITIGSRTLLVELHADNPDGLLQPGAYTEVHFSLPGNPDVVRLPTSALIFRNHGLEVAVVGDDDKVDLRKIMLGRNLGRYVEVLSGLSPTERVVNSPPDSLANGDFVHIADGSPPGRKEAEQGHNLQEKVPAGGKSGEPVPSNAFETAPPAQIVKGSAQ
ncbi:MAG TPA: efflux RND transporter periplasmic adaptor subunit [Methylocella sp.]|nr:efflux RND transporter periplasmic adaptor subunit [Methylocella sp.]